MADKQTKVNMVSSQSWRDHFKIDQSKLDTFWEDFSQNSPMRASEMKQSDAQDSLEFVLWCIQQGHFSEEAFVKWQSEALEIPVVRQAYFEAPVDTVFWERVKEIHPWNASCMPLTEWDDTLIVAIANPSGPSLNLSKRHLLVLALPSRLREYFNRVDQSQSSKPDTSSPTKQLAASTGDDGGDPFAALSHELGISNDEPAEEENDESAESLVLPDGLILPEGLDLAVLSKTTSEEMASPAMESDPAAELDSGTLVHNFETGKDEVIAKSVVNEEPPVQDNDDPLASNDDPLASLVMSTPKPNSAIPELPFAIPRHEEEAPPTPKPLTLSTEPSEPKKPERVRKPLFAPIDDAATVAVTPPKAAASAFEPRSSKGAGFDATLAVSIQNNVPQGDTDQDTKVEGKTGTFAGTQTKSRRLETTPVTSMFGAGERGVHQERPNSPGGNLPYVNKSIAIGKLDPIHLDQCRSIDEAGAQAILQACNIYECAMILLFRGGDLVPWKWNDLFLSVRGDKPETIDLVEPSIFKVVFRTAKPYHGYVVTSEVNQKFFNEFYRGMLPKHATVAPLMIDGRMGGMVLGFTNSKVDYRQSLRLMERLTFDLARVFKSLRGTMAKAG